MALTIKESTPRIMKKGWRLSGVSGDNWLNIIFVRITHIDITTNEESRASRNYRICPFWTCLRVYARLILFSKGSCQENRLLDSVGPEWGISTLPIAKNNWFPQCYKRTVHHHTWSDSQLSRNVIWTSNNVQWYPFHQKYVRFCSHIHSFFWQPTKPQ